MDVDMRLIEALAGHHGHHLQNPAPAQTESNKLSEFASAVSELTNILRSNGQVPQGRENSSHPNGHLSQSHSDEAQASQFAAALHLGVSDRVLLQSLRLGHESLQELLGCSLSAAISIQEGLQNKDGTQNNPHLPVSESSGIGRDSHNEEESAEAQRIMVELSQPATRANSPPPSAHGPGSFSEHSGTSPASHPNGLAREDSQSISPAPYRSNSQVLEMSPAMDAQTPQWSARNSTGRLPNLVGSNSRARQDGAFEDPVKAAERERVRGENRVRKKRWRESNQDRNKDNDLRCRVTKRGNKIWGLEDCEEKRLWMKHEFFRRRSKREAKERARAADETGPNTGAGSSSVFQAYNSSPAPPMSAANTNPIFGNFQTPPLDSQADQTRVALQDLVSLLHSPNATQNLEAAKPQAVQTASRSNSQGQPGNDLCSQQMEPHQPMEIQNTASCTSSDRDNGNPSGLEEIVWPTHEESSPVYHNSSQIKDIVAALRVRFNAPPGALAGGEPQKPLESPMPRWPGPGTDEDRFLETVEVKTELSEVPPDTLQSTEQAESQFQAQQLGNAAHMAQQQGIEGAIEKLSDADIDALFPTNADGEPDLDDEILERLVAESGLCMDELLSRTMEPEAPAILVSSQPSVAQSEHRNTGDLVGDDSEESMSLEQINALLEDLTESMDLDESIDTSPPHSRDIVSHDQATVDPTLDTIATLTSNWRNHQYPSTSSANTISRGTMRCSPDNSSPLSRRVRKPPPQNPIALTQQIQAILQSSDHSQPISRHQVNSSYAASFGHSENMNKRLMKPPPYRPTSKPPSVGITTGPGAAATSHAKSNEHEKKIKSMGFPPLMAGMKPK
ncbi:unnamed protein product [Tuber aestivum]|uniref:DUF3020 domain-containing protein n=1 Tax=Tuber aestivum TaxID=59557 RepID=A0A292Q093_9PEZI|nr:unnamed protein product [Tuber aestivum]